MICEWCQLECPDERGRPGWKKRFCSVRCRLANSDANRVRNCWWMVEMLRLYVEHPDSPKLDRSKVLDFPGQREAWKRIIEVGHWAHEVLTGEQKRKGGHGDG